MNTATFYRIFGYVAIIVLLGALTFSLITTRSLQQPPSQVKVIPTRPVEPLLTLSLDSNKKVVTQGEKVIVMLAASSERPILAIDLYLAYDPLLLEFNDMRPGGYFAAPMTFARKVDLANGKLFLALGALKQPNTHGTLLTYTFTAKSPGLATVSLVPNTLASMKGALKANIHLPSKTEITIQ